MKDTNIAIQFSSLELGSHDFRFTLDNEFFTMRQYEDFDSCNADVNVNLHKEETMLTLNVSINGNVSVQCDRCLDLMEIPIDVRDMLIVKIGDGESDDESIIYVSENEETLDLSAYIYDLILLNLPVRRIHPDDENGVSTCNAAQLEYLNRYEKHDTVDPRWEALRKLKE